MVLFLLVTPMQSYADHVSIDVDEEFLFDVENLKPGDYMRENLMVENTGDHDYYFHAESKFESGSKKLFNQFLLEVTDSEDAELYEGSLADFTGFDPRFLEKGETDEIEFKATLPYESGNEFQGLAVKFKILIWAEAQPTEPNPDPNPKPNPDPEPDPDPEPNPDPDPDPDPQPNPEDTPEPTPGDDTDDPGDGKGGPLEPLPDDVTDESTVEDVKSDSLLPETGEEIPYQFYIAGGLLLIVGTVLFKRKRKVEKYEGDKR